MESLVSMVQYDDLMKNTDSFSFQFLYCKHWRPLYYFKHRFALAENCLLNVLDP